MLISNKFKKLSKTKKLIIDKKMKWKLIKVTLPRMQDKPMSLNTQREKGPLIKLKGS